MRTIKFRGLEANPYCEELRTFLYGTPLFITNEENYILPNFWDYEGLNKFKVLKKTISQFTGLHDKNGKEIYEGDILKTFPIISSDKIAYDSFNVVVRFTSSSWIANGVLGIKQSEISEVIGNIFENPELIDCQVETDFIPMTEAIDQNGNIVNVNDLCKD